jgi:putative flippase GtrA
MNVELGRLIRYGITGALVACFYLGVVAGAVEEFTIPPVAASVLGQIVTITVGYYAHASFSFGVEPDSLNFIRFVFIAITSIFLNIAVMWVLNVLLNLSYVVAISTVIVLLPLYNYLCNRYWVFLPGFEEGFGNSDQP